MAAQAADRAGSGPDLPAVSDSVGGGLRVSTAAILYPALLVTMMRESHRPDTGLVTGLCVVMMRLALDLAAGMPPGRRCGWSIPAACSTSAMTACSAC